MKPLFLSLLFLAIPRFAFGIECSEPVDYKKYYANAAWVSEVLLHQAIDVKLHPGKPGLPSFSENSVSAIVEFELLGHNFPFGFNNPAQNTVPSNPFHGPAYKNGERRQVMLDFVPARGARYILFGRSISPNAVNPNFPAAQTYGSSFCYRGLVPRNQLSFKAQLHNLIEKNRSE